MFYLLITDGRIIIWIANMVVYDSDNFLLQIIVVVV